MSDTSLSSYLSAHVNREFLPPPGLAPLAHRKTLVVEQTLDANRIKDLVQKIDAEPLPVNAFWWQPLQTLLEDMKTHARFSDKGLRRASTRIVDCLSRHAKIESIWNRLPEIAQVPIARPLFIVSLPRTGTTLMHNLLASHPQNDTLKLWETLAPVTPQGSGKQWEPQMKRIASEHLDEIYSSNPELLNIHSMAPEQPDECQCGAGFSM